MALTAEQATKGTIHISARRWFDRGPGNTYHSVQITLPDGRVQTVPFEYGYDEAYRQTAFRVVREMLGVSENPKEYCAWQWYEREGYYVVYDVVDVPRKRDLHKA